MAEQLTWGTLRELAVFRAEQGCAVSLYLDLDPSVTPTAGDVDTRLHSLLGTAERSDGVTREELSHEAREALKGDLQRLRDYVENEFDRAGVHGLAVFAAGADGSWRTLSLGDRVPDEVAVGSTFRLAPLVSHMGGADGALVAVVSRERGEVFRLREGRLHELADLSEEAPRRHDQGGRSQARFQRHVDEFAADHLRTVTDELNRRVRRLGHMDVVIVCAEPMRGDVEALLAKETKDALAGWAAAEAHAGAPELLEVVKPILEGARARRVEETLERWREEAGKGARASSGWAQTLEAASDGKVELLLFRDGANREVWECPSCGRLTAEAGDCPLDGTTLERRDEGLDPTVHQVLAYGGTVLAVQDRPDLDPVEGIGALLRF